MNLVQHEGDVLNALTGPALDTRTLDPMSSVCTNLADFFIAYFGNGLEH